MIGPMEFHFLQKSGCVKTPEDWNNSGRSRLWLYNLHYFDDLNGEGARERNKWHVEYLRRWIEENPPIHGVAWEPYPTSLRIVNWIKWVLSKNDPGQEILHSLAVQARWLRKRLEYHLLGNHLLANAKALAVAGLFFRGEEAAGWYRRGFKILEREFPEQVLADGAHFERSPMYHLIVLEDILDLINIHKVYRTPFPGSWQIYAEKMLAWSRIMRHPDGEISFFNDAAFGVAPSPARIDAYAVRLGIRSEAGDNHKMVHLKQSGYARLENAHALVLADVGSIGPDYLPGHAHAGTLSFELSLLKSRVCVNSGTSTYEPDSLRQWQRSSRAHNTVSVDGADSSETWSAFRVARRANVLVENMRFDRDGAVLTAVHNGYHRLPGKPSHRRTWRLWSSGLRVDDEIMGDGVHTVEIFVHFHPEVFARVEDSGCIELLDRETLGLLAVVRWQGDGELHLEENFWYPEFGKSVPNQCCVFRLESIDLSAKSSFEIDWSQLGFHN
jgi:uncharacterized heparinase superfamily protein